MKSKEALRGEIYSFIVAYNTAKSGGGFDKKVFPHSSATLRLYILLVVHILGRITLPVTKYKTIGLADTKTFNIA